MINRLRLLRRNIIQNNYKLQQTRSRSQWLQSLKSQKCIIEPSVLFTGRPHPQLYVDVGEKCGLEEHVTIWIAEMEEAHPRLQLGKDVFIGRNTYIGVYEPISIGNYAMIGAYSYIISANHAYARRDVPIKYQGFVGQPIVIEDDVWIGTHVVILPGVTVGKGAIVAAGSLVNKNIPAYEIWGGVPAKFIKQRP